MQQLWTAARQGGSGGYHLGFGECVNAPFAHEVGQERKVVFRSNLIDTGGWHTNHITLIEECLRKITVLTLYLQQCRQALAERKPLGHQDGQMHRMEPYALVLVRFVIDTVPLVEPEIDETIHSIYECAALHLRTCIHHIVERYQTAMLFAVVKQLAQRLRHFLHHCPVVGMLIMIYRLGIVCHSI